MAPRRYDRRTRDRAAEATRQRIIRATAELHAEHGCMGTSHAMIAERAGVSLPTVYKSFPTRNDLIPHCTGLVFGEAPVALDGHLLEGLDDVPSRLRALCRKTFQLYAYAQPWLRWSARDALELPALRAILDEAAAGRKGLLQAALAPGFPGGAPRRIVALGAVLLDFPSYRSLTASGYKTPGAAAVVSDTLIALCQAHEEAP
jgi:AcrR family transcriptional regulator